MFIEDEVIVNIWWTFTFLDDPYLLIISARVIQVTVYPNQVYFEFYWQNLYYLNCFSCKIFDCNK